MKRNIVRKLFYISFFSCLLLSGAVFWQWGDKIGHGKGTYLVTVDTFHGKDKYITNYYTKNSDGSVEIGLYRLLGEDVLSDESKFIPMVYPVTITPYSSPMYVGENPVNVVSEITEFGQLLWPLEILSALWCGCAVWAAVWIPFGAVKLGQWGYVQSKSIRVLRSVKATPVVHPNIYVDFTGKGVLAWRTWLCVSWEGKLRSTAQFVIWDKSSMTADKLPTKENSHGMHAVLLGRDEWHEGGVLGLTSLSGQFVRHANGVIRAEKSEIVLLIVNQRKRKLGEWLSSEYKVPVVFVNNPKDAAKEWLLTENGVAAMNHNMILLRDAMGDSLESAVENQLDGILRRRLA